VLARNGACSLVAATPSPPIHEARQHERGPWREIISGALWAGPQTPTEGNDDGMRRELREADPEVAG